MADITICTSKKCEKRNLCYRHTAERNKEWQTYSDFYELCKDNKYEFFCSKKWE